MPLEQPDRLPALVLPSGKPEDSFQGTPRREQQWKKSWLDFTPISGREPLPRQQDHLCGWGMVQAKAKGCGPAKGYDLCEDGDWLLVGQSFHRCRAIHCRDPRDPPCTGMLEVSRRNLMLRPSYVTACDPEIQGNEGVKGRLLRWS